MILIGLLALLTVLSAAASYCWTTVLVEDGMILQPLRAKLYARLESTYGNVEQNGPWWWKPFWGCFKCNVPWVFLAFAAGCILGPGWLMAVILLLGFASVALLLTLSFDKWLNS